MGANKNKFRLYEGTWQKSTSWDQVRRMKSKEFGDVSFSTTGFAIGAYSFSYADIDHLTLEAFSGYNTHFIQIRHKDGRAFVLFPVQGGTENCDAVSRKSEAMFANLQGPWERARREAQAIAKAQHQKTLEAGAVDKIRKMLAVSTRLKMDMMRQVLGFDEATFNTKIFDWAMDFGFKIDGDFVVIEGGDVSSFIASLDKEFSSWGKNVEVKAGKV